MSDYTELKAISNFKDSQIYEHVGANLVMFYDWAFLSAGAFNNVAINQADINAGERSKLKPVSDPNYTSGKIWQAPVRNLVWESGTTVSEPIAISGLFISSAFHPNNGSTYNIDYPNGRVIFNSGLPTSSTVKMAYSNKVIDFKEAKDSHLMQFMQIGSFNISTPQYIANSGDWSTLSPNRIQLPHVAFEISPNVFTKPYEIGSYTVWKYIDVLAHIFTEDDTMGKKLADIFMGEVSHTIYFLDIQKIIENGDYPLDYRGYKKSTAKTYPQLVGSDGSQYRKTKIHFKDVVSRSYGLVDYNFKDLVGGNVHHTVVRLSLEIVQTF